jgi:predicted enzyme related to lactoylglutathione lyase
LTLASVAQEIERWMWHGLGAMIIGNVSVYVDDLDRAIAFYRDVLGWRVTNDVPLGEQRWVTIAPPSSNSGFVLVHHYGDWSPEQVGGWSGVVLDVDNVEQAYAELAAKGVEFPEPPRQEEYGMWAAFADSERNLFGLRDAHRPYAPPPRGFMSKFLGF